MTYKYLLFDLDGTITNSEEGITKSVVYALEQQGIKTEPLDYYRTFIGPPLEESFAAMGMDEAQIDQSIVAYRKRFEVKGWLENTLYDGMSDLLNALQSKYTLGVATSKPTFFAEKILAHNNLTKCFKVIVGSNMDRTRVHKSEVIQEALAQLGHPDPKEVLMIGDRLHDIIGAADHHVDAIRVLYGFGRADEHENYPVVDVCDSVESLKHRLMD